MRVIQKTVFLSSSLLVFWRESVPITILPPAIEPRCDTTLLFTGNLLLKLTRMAMNAKVGENRPFTVIVEGNIGSGKTTFLEYFKKYNNVCVLAEPIEMWRNCNGHNLLVSYSLLAIAFYNVIYYNRDICMRIQRNGVLVFNRTFS